MLTYNKKGHEFYLVASYKPRIPSIDFSSRDWRNERVSVWISFTVAHSIYRFKWKHPMNLERSYSTHRRRNRPAQQVPP